MRIVRCAAFFALLLSSLACSSSSTSDSSVGSAQNVKGDGSFSGAATGTVKGAQIVASGPTGATNGEIWSIGVNGGIGGDVNAITVSDPAGVQSFSLQFDLAFTSVPAPGTFTTTSMGIGSHFGGSISYSGAVGSAYGSYLAGTNDKTGMSSVSLTLKSLVKSNVVSGNDIYTSHGSIDATLVGGTQINGMGVLTKTAPITVHLDF
jgi:hypothetical protein